MGIVYQLTFFVSLGMLGIVVAVFVFAVTQVGSATEAAAKEQESKMLEKRKATLSRIEGLEEKLAEAKKSGELNIPGLSSEVVEMKEELENYDVEIKRIKERVVLITRRGAVVYPGVFLLVVLVLSVTSSGLAESENLGTLAMWMWVISLVPLVFGVYRVYRTLGVVEEVTVGSGEALERLPKAVKDALREVEEEKMPELTLVFVSEQPPFSIETEKEKTIEYALVLSKGNLAKSPEVTFFVPEGFGLPGAETMIQTKDVNIVGGYVSTLASFRDCRKEARYLKNIRIKAPSQNGKYKVFYQVSCEEGFNSELQGFEVIVEDAE